MSFKCVWAFLILVPLAAQAQRGTLMVPLIQPETPATLVRTLHSTDDFLKGATLKNVGTEQIIGYRIGWVEVYPEGKDKVGLGYRIEVPEGVNPSNTTEVPAQGVSTGSSKDGATAVGFFVAEIRTATGVWKADLDKVEDDARKMGEEASR